MQEVASALAFLHGVGVYHADLKPENLLLSTKNRLDGTIKIIDFGCAVVTDDYLDDDDDDEVHKKPKAHKPVKKASSTGTTAYWPPERFLEGGEYSATAAMDMWSVGVILYVRRSSVPFFATSLLCVFCTLLAWTGANSFTIHTLSHRCFDSLRRSC